MALRAAMARAAAPGGRGEHAGPRKAVVEVPPATKEAAALHVVEDDDVVEVAALLKARAAAATTTTGRTTRSATAAAVATAATAPTTTVPSAVAARPAGVAVQSALHAEVGYRSARAVDVPAPVGAVLRHIQDTYAVPATMEVDKVTFGPLSGLSYEDRLISAYSHGQLEPYRRVAPRGSGGVGAAGPRLMCKSCGALDSHWSWDCPASL